MGKIQIVKKEDIKQEVKNGLARQIILEGTCPGIAIHKCTLRAGELWEPKLFRYDEKMQIFFFITATGFVETTNEAFRLTDKAVFVPDFDHDKVVIHSGAKDLEFYHITGPMTEVDHRQMKKCHMILPRFCRLCDSWEYTERFTQESGSKVKSHSILAGRRLGRYTMGWNIGQGPTFIGQHTHPTLEQWYFMLDGSDFTYIAGGKEVPVKAGDVTYTPTKTSHGSKSTADQFINYAWFELNRAWDND